MHNKETNNYRQIVKSSAWIGGSSVINVLFGLVRTKALALFIGIDGLGIFGALSSILTFAGTIAGLGINQSGVRQIAEANATGDQVRISNTVRVLLRTSIVLGTLGALLMATLCVPIGYFTFGDTSRNASIAVLSLAILLVTVSEGLGALIKGMRRIRDLAAAGIMGSLLATLCGIPIIYYFRVNGIVPFLIVVSGAGAACSWWFAKKIPIEKHPLPPETAWLETRYLLKMGLAFMASGLLASGVAFLSRVIIIRQLGLEAAGLYQAAYVISGVYVGFVLTALGADFYPRLTGLAKDPAAVNAMVNEQSEISLLLVIPGILATLTLAHLLIPLLYSTAFAPSVDILRWQILGAFGRVVSWPIAFVLLARARARAYFWSELFAHSTHLLLIYLGLRYGGLKGLGVAYFLLYLLYTGVILLVVRNDTGFRWSPRVMKLIALGAGLAAVVFWATSGGLPPLAGLVLSALITGLVGIGCLLTLRSRWRQA